MFVKNKNKTMELCSTAVVIVCVMLCLSIASFGAELVSISHSLSGYTSDGPTATLDLTLQIVNNTTTVLSGAQITTAPMGPLDRLSGPTLDQAAMQIGDIPASGTISVDYTIESAHILPEEAIGHLPIFWEIIYTDETGQPQMMVVRSEAPLVEPAVTTAEAASPAVSSLSCSGVIAEWVARYNGPADDRDIAQAIALDTSGNVYVTGYSYGGGTPGDYATVKYAPDGTKLWAARYNGPANWTDWARAIAVDNSGNVYVTGESDGSGTGYDYATIKYDTNGNQLWVARYNGPGNVYDSATAIALDSSGNVYVTGYSHGGSYTDYATIKYDTNGNQLWAARYDGPGNLHYAARAIALDTSGNVYVTGHSATTNTNWDYATIKYDTNGNQLWVASYDGPANFTDAAQAIAVDTSGNVYVTGDSLASGYSIDYATIKYDTDGNQEWIARYNGPGNSYDGVRDIAVDTSGNVYVTGGSYGGSPYYGGTASDYATIKYDSSGNQLWAARYNGPGNSSDSAYAMAVDASGNVYVTGGSWGGGTGTGGDYATIKYDTDGNQEWIAKYNGPANWQDSAVAIAVDNTGNAYVTGGSWGSGTDFDYATIKYSPFDVDDPAEAIEALIAAVISLNLQQGIANSLDAKLGAALQAIDDINANNDVAAINTLEAFINAVEAQRGGWISDADADALIAAALCIINMLSTL
ncbi:MAG: SBBP repeat-containing protein [Planctomycetota bacterium]|jgi:hypothetical protein